MKNIITCIKYNAIITIFFFICLSAGYSLSPEEIIGEVDTNISLANNFAMEMELEARKNDKVIDSYHMTGYVNVDEKTLDSKTLIYFTHPPSVEGRKMLLAGKYIWVHFPRTRNIIRLSPMQILLGDVSNGDIARTRFSHDYIPSLLEESEKEGKKCYVLELNLKKEYAGKTYSKIVLYVIKSELIPLYAEFYSSGEKLIKTALYGDYVKKGNKNIPMTLTIQDNQDQTKKTYIHYNKIIEMKIDSHWYNKDALKRFRIIPLQ